MSFVLCPLQLLLLLPKKLLACYVSLSLRMLILLSLSWCRCCCCSCRLHLLRSVSRRLSCFARRHDGSHYRGWDALPFRRQFEVVEYDLYRSSLLCSFSCQKAVSAYSVNMLPSAGMSVVSSCALVPRSSFCPRPRALLSLAGRLLCDCLSFAAVALSLLLLLLKKNRLLSSSCLELSLPSSSRAEPVVALLLLQKTVSSLFAGAACFC